MNVEVPLGIMAYQSRSLPWSAQRCINWYAEAAPSPLAKTKTPIVLLPRPGLALFAGIAGAPRGHLAVGSNQYAVFGTTMYSVSATGVALAIGTISGTGPVTMAATADQITIVSNPTAWVYTIATEAFTQITDASFPGSKWVTQIGGYFVHLVPDESGEFFISNLNNGLLFDSLDFATAEMDADALVAAFADHGELWLFGTLTIEPWGITGAASFPMAPIQSAKIQRGCAAPNSIARQDNTLFWIGEDLCVYRAGGYVPQRVSTHAIEAVLADNSASIGDVIGCAYTQDGHSFYQITLSESFTLVYDNATGLWAERQTFGEEYWQVNYVRTVNNALIGAHENGNLYTLATGVYDDAGSPIRFETTSPPIHANTAKVGMSRLQIDLDAGQGLNTGQGSDPKLMLSWSDDGGRTWSSEHQLSTGKIGEYRRRAVKRRMGKFYSRVIKCAISDPVKPVLIGAYADLDVGPS